MAEREVVYTIRYVADAKAAQVMQDLARQADEAQKRITAAEQAAVVERGRQQAEVTSRQQSEASRSHAEWVRRRQENATRLIAEHLDRQAKMAQAHAELTSKIQAEAMLEMERGSRLALRGIEQIGRGLVILKAIDEDTSQETLKLIGSFEAMAQLGKGIHNAYTGAARALEAYSVSVRAAAIAQAALTAAEAGGGAASAAKSLAKSGGIANALGSGISAIGALAGTVGGAIAIPAVAIGGGVLLNNYLEGRAVDSANAAGNVWTSRYLERGSAQQSIAEQEIARAGIANGLASQQQAALAGVGGLSPAARNQQAMMAARNRASSAVGAFGAAQDGFELGGASIARQTAAAREEVAARQELVQLTQQQYTIEMDRIAASKKSGEDAIRNAKALADSFRAVRDAELDRVKTAEQRFGSLDPLQRQSVLRAAKKASSGEELSEADARLLDGFRDLGNLGQAVDSSRSARARRGGFDELSKLTGADQRVAAAKFFATDAELGARSVIKTESEIRVKLDADAKALGVEIAGQLTKQFEELKAAMLKQLDAERRQRENERNVSAAKSRAAAGS